MNSVILYMQFEPSTEHQEIKLPDGRSVFIRPELSEDDESIAVHVAEPRDGETLLNAVNFPNAE